MFDKIRHFIFGAPKDPKDPEAFHKLSLIALLAWVGLGADGLSSSAYGPDEAFRTLHSSELIQQLGFSPTGLAFFLAVATALTVFIISYGYSRIIEQFPSGGGGYLVASKLLGPRWGVISGSALLVDYVLTITISIASGADAIFSFLPERWVWMKLPIEFAGIAVLTILNMRGVKESVTSLVPIFVIFLITHAILLLVAIGTHLGDAGVVTEEVRRNIHDTAGKLGTFGALKLFLRAYSAGGGTYTGIEAVSNGVGMMREPRVQTAKRTMVMMAVSLAVTAGGIILAYLLMHVQPEEGKTMNAVLFERVAGNWHVGDWKAGTWFVITALFSEGALLFVAAQAGFLDGPRVMASMATDSWLPRRFAALSERLSMRNGVVLMAGSAAAALLYTKGNVSRLVIMYSINVFLTFSLSEFSIARFWIRHRKEHPKHWYRHLPVHVVAFTLCITILTVTILEKFTEGGWITLVVTAILVVICFLIKAHYNRVIDCLKQLDVDLPSPPEIDAMPISAPNSEEFKHAQDGAFEEHHGIRAPETNSPVAILFVGGYSGLGRHALLTMLRMFPGHFRSVVFASVGVVDSESFKGLDQMHELEARTQQNLVRYERYAHSLGLNTASAFAIGTEVQVEAEKLGLQLMRRYPKGLVIAGQLIFQEDTLWSRILHNETAFLIQQRLQHVGVPMIGRPVRLDLKGRRTVPAPKIAPASS
ncbi:MAG: APC family permease [Polyangiales bacterium]